MLERHNPSAVGVCDMDMSCSNNFTEDNIDVLIVSKYINCVTHAVLHGLQLYLQDIGIIHIIVPASMMSRCLSMKLKRVTCYEEGQVLDYEDLWVSSSWPNQHGWTPSKSRGKWYYQQFLKLLAFKKIPLTKKYVIWDSDNVLIPLCWTNLVQNT